MRATYAHFTAQIGIEPPEQQQACHSLHSTQVHVGNEVPRERRRRKRASGRVRTHMRAGVDACGSNERGRGLTPERSYCESRSGRPHRRGAYGSTVGGPGMPASCAEVQRGAGARRRARDAVKNIARIEETLQRSNKSLTVDADAFHAMVRHDRVVVERPGRGSLPVPTTRRSQYSADERRFNLSSASVVRPGECLLPRGCAAVRRLSVGSRFVRRRQ